MVPHSLFVSSDRHVDVTLNLLTALVGGALIASLAYLVFMWLQPAPSGADRGDVGPPAWAAMSDALFSPARIELDFSLLSLPTVYRCEYRGHVTYSDRPCAAGRNRPLSFRPS
jgi:hypothetical protein